MQSPGTARCASPVLNSSQRRGLEAEFAVLDVPISRGAKRAVKRTAERDNLTSAVWLHHRDTHATRSERACGTSCRR